LSELREGRSLSPDPKTNLRGMGLLYGAVFVGGLTSLGIELTASRLLGNIFGTSNLVWANIIGLILVYLTAGYFIGGRWADRSPYATTFYRLLAWASFTAGLVPIAAAPVLRMAAGAVQELDAAVMIGSFVSVLVLFSVPVTLLGCVSPFAIRLALDSTERAGRVSGHIYALSTLGSILGTFLPVLVLIPTIGTARTFLSLSLALMAVALAGLWRAKARALRFLWMPLLLLLLAALTFPNSIKATEGQVYEGESAYNYIEVVKRGGVRYLLLNEGQGVHSIYDPDQLATFGTWDYFLAAPFYNPVPYPPKGVNRLGIVGLAAGTIARQYTAVYGPIPIDGWEIDPGIIAVGREYFDMREPNLNAIPEDGRWGVEHSPHRYSVIAIDAYRPPYIPWHLTTREFFRSVYAHLEASGVLAINVWRTPQDRRLVEAMAATIGEVFPSVHVVDVPDTFNSVIYATVQQTEDANLVENLRVLNAMENTHPLLLDALTLAAINAKPTPQGGVIFTDDLAPVERIANSIVMRFVLQGGFASLPSVGE
jgi:spermidine synthase